MFSRQEKETVEDQRTREYRQLASYLASVANANARNDFEHEITSNSFTDAKGNSSTPSLFSNGWHALPSVRVAQHLLTNHPGWIPLGLLNSNDDNDSSTHSSKVAASTQNKQIVLPCCPHCGGPLQPGFQNATVRLLHSGAKSRSQRRRLSRRVARIHQIRKKQGNRNNTTPQLSRLGYFVKGHFGDDSSASNAKRDLTFNRLERINCRNMLQIRCGACGGHSQLPGFSRPRVTKKPKEAPTRAVAPASSAAPTSEVDPTADFVTLSNTVETKEKAKKKREQVIMLSSVGSKKRKADSRNKNKLMNFLSSLNDH